MAQPNPYAHTLTSVENFGEFFSIQKLKDERVKKLPFSIRVLLESGIRNCDEFEITSQDVETTLDWQNTSNKDMEINFKPARVIMQDFTGVPAIVDLTAMRDAIDRLGGDLNKINPLVPTDLVIDHSVQVDVSRSIDAVEKNQAIEFERNEERFQFLKWGSTAYNNMLIIPPGSGIVHQVNLEYLARIVFQSPQASKKSNLLYNDTVVGTDSHTTMINGLGVVGWGVGGIEAEAVMLNQAISMTIPQVVGFRLKGALSPLVTATDLVLNVTSILRKRNVVGKFVEFYGEGVKNLSVTDRATISNMAPEYGATIGYFPLDEHTLDYLRLTGRDEKTIACIKAYSIAQGLFQDYKNDDERVYSGDEICLDLATVLPSVAGPKRPHDCVALKDLKKEFREGLTKPITFKSYGLADEKVNTKADLVVGGKKFTLTHGSVVIAAITSCTNTSNPSLMLSAGLIAKNARKFNLNVQDFIKTSLSPGSGVAKLYLEKSGLLPYLEELGFYITGYGCMTCIGNSGDLSDEVSKTIVDNDLVVSSVLSGNRNFEGRVHPLTRANYLASPPLVIAFALAGRSDIDFEKEPLGIDQVTKKEVFLKDIWPTKEEVKKFEDDFITPQMYIDTYKRITDGSNNIRWQNLQVVPEKKYQWSDKSTYIHNPPFFKETDISVKDIASIEKARCLLLLGDSITTDHISPASKIAKDSPAARYLIEKGVQPRDFNSYGSRRGNDEVMVRGTFANVRLVNKMMNGEVGSWAINSITKEKTNVYDVAMYYKNVAKVPSVVIAGKEYGSGSSRDWAAKGVYLLGVKCIIAESYERIHRSNLVGMGILPLQFLPGESAETFGLTGYEEYSITLNPEKVKAKSIIDVSTACGKNFKTIARIDTLVEEEYFRQGGILQYTLRKIAQQ